MDTTDDAFAQLADDLADTRERQPFALITGRSPRTALRHFARTLGLPEYASVAVLNEVEADRSRGRGVYRDLYTPYTPTLAAVLRGRWTWPDVKWERSHGRWAFTDDVPAAEIIAVARRYVRYVMFVDDTATRIYDGAIDAAELERRLLATELWPEPVVIPATALFAAIAVRLPALDVRSVAVMLPPEEPSPHGEPARFVLLHTALPTGRHLHDLALAVRGRHILARAAEPERMPVLLQLAVTPGSDVEALTSVPIRDRVVVPGLVAAMLATLRHFGAGAREYVRVDV